MRALIGFLSVALWAGASFADEPAVVNDPLNFYGKAVQLVDSLQPRGGAFLNIENGQWQGMTAARVASYKEVDVVLGFSVDKTLLGAVEVDALKQLSKVPGVSIAVPWVAVHTGIGAGYSWDHNDPVWGPTFDVSVKF